MCTTIAVSSPVRGMGRGPQGWFALNKVTVGYDHATHSEDEHAVLIDFTNYDIGLHARVAVELDLESGYALLEQLRSALEQAAASGVH
jgi:hypothetical protein